MWIELGLLVAWVAVLCEAAAFGESVAECMREKAFAAA
jgi:hypothetical protein